MDTLATDPQTAFENQTNFLDIINVVDELQIKFKENYKQIDSLQKKLDDLTPSFTAFAFNLVQNFKEK